MASSAASSTARDDLGRLVLRLTIGLLILLHGIAKLGGNLDWISAMLGKAGLPAALAYGVYLGELVAPLLLVAGVYTRVAALVIVVNMLFAIGLVHMGHIGTLTEVGAWGIETQALFLFGALAIVLLGAGRYSLGGARGRCN